MITLLKYVLYLVVAALLIAFAVANHESVVISLDPLSKRDDAAFSFAAPMFVVLLISVMIGVVAGGLAVWFGQHRHRRAARQFRSENEKLRAQAPAPSGAGSAKLARRA
jgi:uncharacterized integral membrane protein